ncbi:S-layer homology domain-containing protein [Cohnella herbarum]|uniref:SLH domain-containing protein n=1 Tax=Cohnella herbarum TaxID=2728023 RepID=A0A7Z2VIG8_9BACL|nr:S-layer homology domain-containing protein [Cohnella herbarum]QJD83838.1 hypothetical protein HH215_12030 [Cohnella herbarum]
MLFIVGLLMCAIGPMQRSNAAQFTRITVMDADLRQVSYLIAGVKYYIVGESDKASSTSVENYKQEYSTDNGATWLQLPQAGYDLYKGPFIYMPIDPQLVSVKFRMSAYFDPLIGSLTYSEKTIGPFNILQPGDVSDFTTIPNKDGSVTLNWNDNSNMESYYEIVRSGPDGDKIFYVKNTKDHIGPLKYEDKQTNTVKRTIYVYKVTPVIDQYSLPDYLQPGNVWSIVKTDRELIITDKVDIDLNLPIFNLDSKIKIDPSTPIKTVEALDYLKHIDLTIGDLDKKPVKDVKLDKSYLTLKTGVSATLTPTISPPDAAITRVKWESSNSQIAEVDASGKVTGKSPGAASISATTEMGNLKAICLVYVESDNIAKPENPPVVDLPGNSEKPQVPPAAALSDIAGHKSSAEISEAVALGVVFGYSDGTFRPDENVTHAEFASMIIRALKPEGEGTPLVFKDKNEIGAWAVKPVQQAVKLGIIKGGSDGKFRPSANISRAEMIAMVIRASGLEEDKGKPTVFADDADIPGWAKPSVSKAEETGIIIVGGLPEGKFAPLTPSTRADAASAIVRMLKLGQ